VRQAGLSGFKPVIHSLIRNVLLTKRGPGLRPTAALAYIGVFLRRSLHEI
jgi:hypothetical protein